jgi:hypothetical protein
MSVMQIRTSCERRSTEESSVTSTSQLQRKYALPVSADPPRALQQLVYHHYDPNTHMLGVQIRRVLIIDESSISIMQIRTICQRGSAKDFSVMGTPCQLCKYVRAMSADSPRTRQ